MAKTAKHETSGASAQSTLPASIVNSAPVVAEILGHAQEINKLVATLEKQINKTMKGGAIPAARSFVAFHRLIGRIDESLKPLNELYDKYKTKVLPELFEQSGVPHVSLEEGFRVGVSSRFVASIIPDQRDKAFNWLRTHGFSDLITSTVNAQTLSAAAKVMREEQNRELPVDLFRTADLPNVSVTKTK